MSKRVENNSSIRSAYSSSLGVASIDRIETCGDADYLSFVASSREIFFSLL
jgi:hypothetical protein